MNSKRIVKYVLLTICGLLLFSALNQAETVRRGYAAIGGEAAFVLLPVLWWAVETTAKDMIQLFKSLKDWGE